MADYVGSGGVIFGGVATTKYGVLKGSATGIGGVKSGGVATASKVRIKTYIASGGVEAFGPRNDSTLYAPPYYFPLFNWLIREVPGTLANYQQVGRAYFTETQNSNSADLSNKNMFYRRDPVFSSTTQKYTFATKFHVTHHEARKAASDDWTTMYYDEYFVLFQLAEWSPYDTGGVLRDLTIALDLDTKFSGSYIEVYATVYDYDTDSWDSPYDVYTYIDEDYDRSFLGKEHILVVQVDTTQENPVDRVKIYIDDELQAHYDDWSSYPEQDSYLFDGTLPSSTYSIGWMDYDSGQTDYEPAGQGPWYCHYVGTLSQTYFIEGAIASKDQLYSSGYAGSYGSSGFYLTYTAQDMGIDYSGNDNHFTQATVNPVTVSQPSFPKISLSGKVFTFYCELNISPATWGSSYTQVIYAVQQQGGIWPHYIYDNVPEDLETLYFVIGSTPDNDTLEIKLIDQGWEIFRVRTTDVVPDTGYVSIQVNVDTTQRYWLDRLRVAINNVETAIQGYPNGYMPPYNYDMFNRGHNWDNVRQFIASIDETTPFMSGLLADGIRNIILVDGFSVPVGSMISSYSGPYGNGFHLRFDQGNDFVGSDSSPRENHFSQDPGVNYQVNNSLNVITESSYGIGSAINFQLYIEDVSYTSVVIGLGFRLYSGVEVFPEIEFELLVDGKEISIPFRLVGSGASITSPSIVFQLYNNSDLAAVTSAKWGQSVLLNSVDISSLIVGDISIEQEEDASAIASFTFLPSSGSIDPLVYVGKEVLITYHQYGDDGTLYLSKIRFTGKVADVKWDPDTRSISVSADTQLPAKFNAMSKENIASFIGGLWSKYVWSDEDDKSGWTYAQERLSTTENCLYTDEYGIVRMVSFLAKRSGGTIVPDFVFTDNERFHESLTLEYAQRSEMTNKVVAEVSYAYQRLRQREVSFRWHTSEDACAFLRWPGNWQLCQRSMVESAATSGTWVAISPITYQPVWAAGCYSCTPPGGGQPGSPIGSDVICWNIGTVQGFVNGSPTSVDPATGKETSNEGFAYDYVIDASFLCNGASWRAAARWVQDVTENYEMVIKCSDSISAIGEVTSTEEYNLQNEEEHPAWENSITPFKPSLPAGYKRMPGNTGDVYVNVDESAKEGTLNRAEFEEAQNVILASTRGDILRAHRLTTVSLKIPFHPSLDLSHTVKVDTPYLVAEGKVRSLKDLLSVETGEASTEVVLAISRHNGSGIYEDSELSPIERPEPTEEDTIPSTVTLHTYKGGRDLSPVYDEEAQTTWEGFLTNYLDSMVAPDWSANPVKNPLIASRTYPYSFVVRGPTIDEEHTTSTEVAASQSYEVVVPEDTLELTV
jgi:hypothetical protein